MPSLSTVVIVVASTALVTSGVFVAGDSMLRDGGPAAGGSAAFGVMAEVFDPGTARAIQTIAEHHELKAEAPSPDPDRPGFVDLDAGVVRIVLPPRT